MASKTATVSGVPVKTEYTLVGDKITSQTNSGTTLYFCYDANGDVFGFIYNNQSYYYLKNLLGDVIKVLDSNGNEIVSYSYDTWGVCTASNNSIIGAINPFRYRSYYFDTDSGLYFLQSRYYDPSIGRFINFDDISYLGATGTVLSYNIFAYCENDAVNSVDPEGTISLREALAKAKEYTNRAINSIYSYFRGLIYYDRKSRCLKISTGVISNTIDAIVASAVRTYVYNGIKGGIRILLKNKSVRNQYVVAMLDFLIYGNGRKAFKYIVMAGLSISGVRGPIGITAENLVKGYVSNLITSKSFLLQRSASLISAFSSVGGIIALCLDFMDKSWDNYVTLRI